MPITARAKGAINQDRLKQRYRLLLNTTSRVVGQAKRFSAEIAQDVKQATSVLKQLALEGLRPQLDEIAWRRHHRSPALMAKPAGQDPGKAKAFSVVAAVTLCSR